MSEMTEQERGAAVIARSPQRYADLRAITELRSFSPEETVLLVRVANAGADLIQAQHRELDRLTAERDAARANEARWRERINAIIAIAESYECLAQNPDVETSVSQERLGFAQDIYQALGIESEASE